MHAIADTEKLVKDGIINAEQAREIESRARETMIAMAVNSVLTMGIIAATAGLIFWLANALSVAVMGAVFLAVGLFILARGGELYRIFGNAAALIGAGMLLGGGVFELIDKYEAAAGWIMVATGAAVLALGALALLRGGLTTRFVTGAIFLMGVAIHLSGLGLMVLQHNITGGSISLFYLYATLCLAGAGTLCDIRFITAAAIVPFAQMLDTGTFYMHALYAFYSPEPTLSIVQMVILIALCLWVARSWPERVARHARVLSVLAFVVANLCALVGSLWGDIVGDSYWGPVWSDMPEDMTWEEFEVLRDSFRARAISISAGVYAILWAAALAAMVAWSAHRAIRGLFNAAMTFGAIHAYTQIFESFADEPLAYVIGGLAAIPLAWGMWRLNGWLQAKGAGSGAS